MKNLSIHIILCTFALLFTVSCDSFKDAFDAKEVAPLTVSINVSLDAEGISSVNGLKIKFENTAEAISETRTLTGNKVDISDILPGIYNIYVSGKTKNAEGVEFYLNGTALTQPLYGDNTEVNILVKGLELSPLVFKEIYYSTSKTDLNKPYICDQFYELYNNSSETIYLDGIHFADLCPGKASSHPQWPAEDGDKYVYGIYVWKVPGNGTDYPLAPGESCVLSQYAVNHQLDIYNPLSPVDCTSVEFEFFQGTKYPDSPAPNMICVFYNGKSTSTVPQYLTSNSGGAFVIFRVPEGTDYDPVNNTSLQAKDGTKATLYARIPTGWIIEAVECGTDKEAIQYKRVPSVLDAGMTYVDGGVGSALGVARKLLTDDDGNIIYNEDGSVLLQDTNNSSEDFERNVTPTLRRYNAKMPSWNHTLK